MRVRTNEDMNRAILFGLRKVPRDADLIVGIPRSGLLAATLFSLYLNKPLTDLQGLAERRLIATGKRAVANNSEDIFDTARRILVVDDCVSQGTEMRRARKLVEELGDSDRTLFLSVYSFPERPNEADIVLEVIPRPICFQWSVMHSPSLSKFCVDIDGLLCVDTTNDEDDDGPKYERFLRTATPLLTPSVEIGWLVTCRLEKYRALTEEWMAQHEIRYRHLIMMDYASKQEREAARQHAHYKAQVYKETGARLFIESSPGLAERISELSGQPVLSFHTGTLLRTPPSQQLDVLAARVAGWKRRLQRAPRKLKQKVLG